MRAIEVELEGNLEEPHRARIVPVDAMAGSRYRHLQND